MQELRQKNTLLPKIAKSELLIKELRKENRVLKQRIRDLETSRRIWKQKYQASDAKETKVIGNRVNSQARAKGYHYSNFLIKLCVQLYLSSGCGYRGIVQILLCFELEFGVIGQIPSKSIISVWVEKLGCYSYCQRGQNDGIPYGLIIDECMVIGQQRLLVVLAIGATKSSQCSLNFADVELIDLSVKTSWNGADISQIIEKVQEKKGYKASYTISDSCSNLRKGIADAGQIRLFDVSHQVALLLEKHYKDRIDFVAWQKALSLAKFQGIMQAHAYLLPPKQRTIARFMNLSDSVQWSVQLLANWHKISSLEEDKMQFLKEHLPLIEELKQVFQTTQQMIALLKTDGLSYDTIGLCKKNIRANTFLNGNSLAIALDEYLDKEMAKLPDDKTVWHCCSEVIESLFGKFKENLPTNPLCGVSGGVLCLPLRTDKGLDFNIQQALETVSLADLKQWKKDKLPDNMVVKRNKILKK